MSENKNITKSLDNAIDLIKAGGFEKGQMQAVVAKDSDWLIERLQGSAVTDVDLFNIWLDEQTAKLATSGFSADDIINSRAVALTMLKLPCGSRQMMDGDISKFLSIKHLPISPPDPNFDGDEMERALCDLKHNKQFVPEIALAHLIKKQEMIMVSTSIVDQCSSAVLASKHGNNPAVADSQNLYKSEYPFDTSADVCFQKVPSNVEDMALCNDIHIATFGNQAEIVMTFDALRKRNPFRVCLQKTPSGFVHGCVRGWTALRLNGLIKRKCKKGARKHYSKKIN